MTLHRTVLTCLLAGLSFAAQAQQGTVHPAHETDAARFEQAPFAPVYIVTSRDTYINTLQQVARNGVARRDSIGADLVVSEIEAHQLPEVSERIHVREKRCGGYFAFATRAQADAFIRNDRSAQARSLAALVDYTIDNHATVDPWLPQVQAANILGTINHLSTAYPNRYYASSHGQTSANWIRDTWAALANGRTDVSTELFSCGNCSTQPSVILTIQGTDLPGEIVVLGAHLDSINTAGGGENMVAPGADDDASGIATLTEVLRVALASGWKPKRTVKFMGYAAEEVGLRGSNAIAQSFQTQGKNVVGVLQLDMTNYKVGNGVDMQLITDYSNASMKTFLTNLFDAYMAPLGMTRGSYTCGYGCSDHASWTSAGFPSAMMFEAGDEDGDYFPYIHSANDKLQNMGNSASHSAKFAKFGLAFLGELGKTTSGGPGPGNTPPVANFTAAPSGLTVQFTDTSTDSDGSIASRSWNFGDGGTSTAANPSHAYAAAGSYSVSLTVTDDDGATHTRTQSVVVSDGSGNVLSKGVPVTGLAATTGNALNYTMVVPAGATNLSFAISGGSGDADMYVRFGSAPTDTAYDCRPYRSGNAETCTFAAPQAGTYHVRLKAYSSFSGVSLVGDYATGGGGGGTQTYSNGTDYPIDDNATVDSPIAVSGRTGNAPGNASVSFAIVHTYKGDLKVDLVAPDGTLYNLHDRTGGSADNVSGTFTKNLSSEALNGGWKLRVNDNSRSDTGYIDSWSITF
ncbi:M20/M25/M40 family metallo-hydrolase [Luteimonas sp. SX5]|uniref:M20/M25/M40 family metallo-hydrolase n=1 Tax=Luteimonas galliterrae TaxID=2940486 RepID=A0ABT0MHS6_9GAMM|nr:M20/M25/M40 family metallo-hydrolase [Luteimonas galliterrae]MCL1634416.1 M20/M25/M40 family metallo-hydrolase [Luteimonas galliterrae]